MSLSLFCAVSFHVLSFYESFLSIDYIIHWGQKIESAQKFHTMHGNQFWLAWPLQFWRFCPFLCAFKTAKISLLTIDYSLWGSKNLIDRNWLKKFMQVWIDVTYLCTDFSGCGLSGFGDTATLKNGQISLSDHGL